MLKLLILAMLIGSIAYFVRQLRNTSLLTHKKDELEQTEMEGDATDMSLEIAEEKARQRKVQKEIDELDNEQK